MGTLDWKKKVELIRKFREEKGIGKEDRRAAYKALEEIDAEKEQKVREYEVYAVIPADDTGHLYTQKIDKFMAGGPAEAVAYASEKWGIFPFDAKDYADEGSREYFDTDDCGIMKVRAITDGDKMYTEEDMLRCVELVFKNHMREILETRGSLIDYNNSPEVLELVINKFNLPKNNRLTEIYKTKRR